MKKMSAIASVAAALACFAAEISGEEIAMLAIKDTVADATVSLAASKIPAGEGVAILPLDGESMPDGLLKNALVEAGKTCVEGKEDPVWNEILKEIAWDERKGDILDPATLDRFGALKSAKYLMYGGIRRVAGDKRYVMVELELHVSSISTKEHVWGGVFVRRHYAPGAEPSGPVDIPFPVRAALVDGMRGKISASLAGAKDALAGKKVAVLPVAGDVDQYAAGLFRDAIARSSATPVNLDVATRAEARFAMREGGGRGNAIAYGALRDLESKLVEKTVDGREKYSASMEMQLSIEDAATRAVLWSDTVSFSASFEGGASGWWDRLCSACPFFKSHPSAIVWLPLAVLLGLVVLFKILRAMTRVR